MFSLTLVATTRCQFSCDYCYARHTGAAMDMPVDLGCRMIEQAAKRGHFGLAISGGEPLLVWENVRKWISAYREVEPGGFVQLTTNAFLLDDTIAEELSALNVHVSVSIDGDEETHNRHRRTKQGEGTFQQAFANILANRAKLRHLEVRLTVSPRTAGKLHKDTAFLISNGFRRIKAVPDYLSLDWNCDSVATYRAELLKILELVRSPNLPDERIVFARFHSQRVTRSNGPRIACAFGDIQVLPDGSLYACTCLRWKPTFKSCDGLRAANHENWSPPPALMEIRGKLPSRCVPCEHARYCRAVRCLAMNYLTTGDFLRPSDSTCALERVHFELERRSLSGAEDQRQKQELSSEKPPR